jgi:hypothetical protein
MLNGEILVNMPLILSIKDKGKQIEELKHILAHELIHATVANNYRDFSDTIKGGFMRRRT